MWSDKGERENNRQKYKHRDQIGRQKDRQINRKNYKDRQMERDREKLIVSEREITDTR